MPDAPHALAVYHQSVGALCGVSWRTAGRSWSRERAMAVLRGFGDPEDVCAAQAFADAADFWRCRAASGDTDTERAILAAERLEQLAIETAGHPVEPTPCWAAAG
ncbi:MAG TPA: hypothetical protein VHC49_19800 [Mycobacteriales bacterium]|nr:hypothetical protein [Mycobacteriales bacterium]